MVANGEENIMVPGSSLQSGKLHTHAHTCIHTHTHTHAHTHMHACMQEHIYTDTHIYAYTYTYTYTYIYIHTYMYTCPQPPIEVQILMNLTTKIIIVTNGPVINYRKVVAFNMVWGGGGQVKF